jgi:hypothetical protein
MKLFKFKANLVSSLQRVLGPLFELCKNGYLQQKLANLNDFMKNYLFELRGVVKKK